MGGYVKGQMLKRPPEAHWNFKKPPHPYPQTPGCNGCFLAPSGQGKTTTLIALLLGPYKDVFDEVHVFSPSVDIDSAWAPVKTFADRLKASSFHGEWDEQALRAIMDRQRDTIKALKDAKSKKPLPQVLTVIDDFSDRYDVMHAAANILTTLFIRGRHFGSSCWLSSQKLTAISPVARVNLRFMLVWRLRSAREIDALIEELSALYPKQILYEMYEKAITHEDHSYWFIDMVAKQVADMFFIRFEHKMILDP